MTIHNSVFYINLGNIFWLHQDLSDNHDDALQMFNPWKYLNMDYSMIKIYIVWRFDKSDFQTI